MDGIFVEGGEAKITLNGKFYDIQAVLKAGQKMDKDFFVLVDGDPTDVILITMKPKQGADPEKGAYEFLNVLLGEMKELV